jgi:hypothetical protein
VDFRRDILPKLHGVPVRGDRRSHGRDDLARFEGPVRAHRAA